MLDIGAILRAAREEQGLTLSDVETSTRIRIRILEALENNEVDLVRGDPHYRGFLRNYAHFLGLEAQPMLDSVGLASQPLPQPRTSAREPRYLAEPLQNNPVPWGRILFTLLVLLLVGAAAFYVWGPQSVRDTLFTQVSQLRGAAAGPTATATITAIVPVIEPTNALTNTEVLTDTEEPVTEVSTSPTATQIFRSPTPEEVATAVPTITLPPRTPTPNQDATAQANATVAALATQENFPGIVVRAHFTEDSYIYFQADQNPDLIFNGVLPAGHDAEWRANEEVYLNVGNAGGVIININGQDYGTLGGPGEVVERIWRVDPEGGAPIEDNGADGPQ